MDKELREFFIASSRHLPENWDLETKASELGRYVIENGPSGLPELSIDGGPGVPQEIFDREVEGAYSFFRWEALRFLKGE